VVNGEFWLTVATFILVIVTAYYAWQTRKTVKVLEASGRQQLRPFLKADLVPLGPTSLCLEISNVGPGAAEKVKVTFGPEGSERSWETPILKSGQAYRFFIPVGQQQDQIGMNYFKGKDFILRVKGEYESVLGEKFNFKDNIDVSKWVEQFERTSVIYEEEIEKILVKISNEIEVIRKEIEKIRQDLKLS